MRWENIFIGNIGKIGNLRGRNDAPSDGKRPSLTGADASEKYQFGENLGVRLAARRAKPSLRAGDNGPGED